MSIIKVDYGSIGGTVKTGTCTIDTSSGRKTVVIDTGISNLSKFILVGAKTTGNAAYLYWVSTDSTKYNAVSNNGGGTGFAVYNALGTAGDARILCLDSVGNDGKVTIRGIDNSNWNNMEWTWYAE